MRFQGIKIKDITYKNTEFVGEYEEDKKVILDLYCTNEKGEHFLIEVQRAEQEFFKKRLLFYAITAIIYPCEVTCCTSRKDTADTKVTALTEP